MTSISDYIIHDVVAPAFRNTVVDMVQGSIEMLMLGTTKGTRTSRDRGKSYVSYNSYYKDDRGRGQRREKDDNKRESRNRARHNFDDIILETRGEAEQVLSHLVDLTDDYGQATVADLYDLVGIESVFTDDKYGWTNLARAEVSRVRNGYLINLPKTQVVD